PCFEMTLPRGQKKTAPSVNWTPGQEACLFLKRHYSGEFYESGFDNFIRKELNLNFVKDLDLTWKCVKLLGAPEKSLKSSDVKDRLLTATMLIRKYRGPAPTFMDLNAPAKKSPKQEPISAEQSKLILKALAEADWSLAKEPFPSPSHPVNLFRRLGLTAKDGWPLNQKPVNPLDGKAGYRAHQEITAAAKKWLKANAGKYQ